MEHHAHHEHSHTSSAEQHTHPDHHSMQQGQHAKHDHGGHGGHVMHEGHATLMRDRFWIALVLTIPVLLYSEMIQMWFGFTPPAFPGSQYITLVLGTAIFLIGGLPFLDMARQELALRQPGMMTLITLAISTAYFYSVGIFFFAPMEMDFFWELATLITVMLLGHWIELRSVGQAAAFRRDRNRRGQ
jgi:P-type Cu2+ transporter